MTRFPARTVGLSLLVVAAAVPAARLPAPHAGFVAALAVVVSLFVGIVAVVWWLRSRLGTSATVGRWSARSRRNDGVANWFDHLRVSSSWAMRRKATTLRPSLASLGRWERYRVSVTEYATPLAKAGWHTIWSPVEDVTLRVGGPRTGKTGELACRVVDAPGAVVATSTRTDIVELTAPSRMARGPVHVFNPSALGGWASTLKWSPLAGCWAPSIATRRAADMIPASASPEGERWDQQARRVLGVLLHAAALGEYPMRSVLAWVADPGRESHEQVSEALAKSSEAKAMQLAAEQFFGLNSRTQTSITATAMSALGWLADSRAAAVADCGSDEWFDVRGLLDQNGTVYLLGGDDGTVAPLVAALTAEIAYQARGIASTSPGGRLDPPLTIALDEAALICPVPLDRWSADFGGRGITLHISIQSRAQLRQRWGDAGAATLLNNTSSVLIYGGTRDPGDLDAWSTLSGERDEEVDGATHRVPVLSPAQIANLPAGYCMIVRRGMPASVGRTRMAWKRRDIRKANRWAPYSPIVETAYELAEETE